LFEWNMSVQKMLDCIEENLTSTFTLEMLAKQLNYSPYYCTRQFHKYAGISLRDYIRLRKVSSAVIDLRDTGERILDIAVKYGFSSQEAFTRSFKKAYGMTPNEYRKMPKPLPLMAKRNVFDPYYLGLGDTLMKKEAQEVTVRIQVIPAHRFIGIRHIDAPGYWEFWKKEEEKYDYDRCSEIDGVLESIPGSINSVCGGWFYQDCKQGYMYGIDVPPDYSSEIPEGMESLLIREAPYAVFHHPPYDYATMERSVGRALDKTIEQWHPTEHGYEWDDTLPTYQRHNPPKYGQAIVKPLKKLK